MRRLCVLIGVVTLLVPARVAGASQILDRNAQDVQLAVNASGQALVSYSARGKTWHVLAWGAVNALPPTAGAKQVAFRLDYSGGWGSERKDAWKTFRSVCRPYDGPTLAWLVTACTMPDDSNWALQSWQRQLPNYGITPTNRQAVWELHLSHWTGQLPQLSVNLDWAYRRFDHLFGAFTYAGAPVHGFRSTHAGVTLDAFGRNLYVDTFDSAYGKGWKRENSFLTHKSSGAFCYGFYPHKGRPAGKGSRYRATIIGPGVTPDVMWVGNALGRYDRALDLQRAREQRELYGHDRICHPV